jgi:selenide, water dikinase
VKRLVLAGGGHAHVEVLRRLGLVRRSDLDVVLVSPLPLTPYSGMLPGVVAGHYTVEEACIDLVPLARFAGARFVRGRVTAIDADGKTAQTDDGSRFPYDVLSIDTGSVPPRHAIAGADASGVSVKPVEPFLEAWQAVLDERPPRTRCIAVVGAGAGGVELAFAMRAQLRRMQRDTAVVLCGESPDLLPSHSSSARRCVRAAIASRGVRLQLGHRVTRIAGGKLHFADGSSIDADWIVWATGAAAPPWLRTSGLALDPAGFVLTDASLRSVSHPAVHAAGDVATAKDHPHPKSGVYAVRQGPPLFANLMHALDGETPQPWVPQPRTLALLSTGDGAAIASWGSFALTGAWAWRWKDRIDRGFMTRYRDAAVAR